MDFLKAVLILSGLIIGAGMFGIPFSFAQVGFFPAITTLLLVTGIIFLLHYLYGEIVLYTKAEHRLPGYVRIYLGQNAALVSLISYGIGISGALLAYIVLGSKFLHQGARIFGFDAGEFFWAFAFLFFGASIMLFPLRRAALMNGILTSLLVLFIIFLYFILLPQIEFSRVSESLFDFDARKLFILYGVLLFALSGAAAIPNVILLLRYDHTWSIRAIFFGTGIPALLYFLFAVTILGVSGPSVSEDALGGLASFVSPAIYILGMTIGFLAVFTSFVVLGTVLKEVFMLDFLFPKIAAWGMVSFLPMVLYLLGFQNFISIIVFVGAVAVGIDALMLIASYHAMQKSRGHTPSFISLLWKSVLFFLIIVGIAYQIVG